MNEYIKREDALAVIYAQHVGGKEACENARPNTFGADLREIASDIEDIPAADVVERKRGEWVHLSGDEWLCPFCGHVISTEGSWEHPHECGAYFCENCGADMREAAKEADA